MATKKTPEGTQEGLTLGNIILPGNPSDTPDEHTKQEIEQTELAKKKAEVQKLNQDLLLRQEYSKKLFVLISLWLIAIFLVIGVQGLSYKTDFFNLSDKVLITIIGGTTINVLGLFAIVANYIFPRSSETKISRKPK